jgi:hypothetical protein
MDGTACEHFDEIAAEVALGIATGEERANALTHAAGCERCRELLGELSSTADGLLMLTPRREPSVGFESSLQRRIDAERTRPQRQHGRLRSLLPAGLAAAAILILGISWVATRDDRRLASDYRAALGDVDGEYFTTFALLGPDEQRVGNGFAYEGDPSWVFVTFDAPEDAIPSGPYEFRLELSDGSATRAVPIDVSSGRGSGGASFAGELDALDGLRFRGPSGPIALSIDSAEPIYP